MGPLKLPQTLAGQDFPHLQIIKIKLYAIFCSSLGYVHKCLHTVRILNFGQTNLDKQTVESQLLLEEKCDQNLPCLLFHLHHSKISHHDFTSSLFKFQSVYSKMKRMSENYVNVHFYKTFSTQISQVDFPILIIWMSSPSFLGTSGVIFLPIFFFR